MGLEIADLRGLGSDYSGQMVVYLAGGANPITDAEWATYQPDPGFTLNTPRAPQFDVLNILSSPDQPAGVYTYYTDSQGFTWQAVAAVENRVYPFDAADYTGYDPPITSSAQAGYAVVTPLPGTIQYNSNDKNHENIYYANDEDGQPQLQYFITDPWGNVYILKSVNEANDTPDKVAAAVQDAVLPDASWVKSSGYLTSDTDYLPTYSGDIAHANEFRDSADNAWMQISWSSSGVTLAAVVGEGMPIWGGPSSDLLIGTENDDVMYGGAGDDMLEGVGGNDRISGDAGNDTIVGGSGTTTAVFHGTLAEYTISYRPGEIVVTDNVAGRDGTDTLENVQDLAFSDGTVIACFAAGTAIATPDGEISVQRLHEGMAVCTTQDVAARIVWIGHRTVDCRRHRRQTAVWPIRIKAHAFAENCPSRDLRLSPDHAVYVDGVLIPIKYLINDTSIRQVPCDRIDYWHIELAAHAVILANGLPTESYLDTGNRSAFANGGGAIALHPDFNALAWEVQGYAPRVVAGRELDAIRNRLADRWPISRASGYRTPIAAP